MSKQRVVQKFENGLTVRELKELIKDWPEVDNIGEESEVWVSTEDGYSNQVKAVWPLNSADVLLDTSC